MDCKILTLSDKNEIYGVMMKCAEALHDQSFNDPAIINSLAQKFSSRACFLAAYNGGEVIGFAAFYCNDHEKKTAFLSMIAVLSNFRNKGGGVCFWQKLKIFAGKTA